MTKYRIKNWDKYQHYKTGSNRAPPPWVKVHTRVLSSPQWVGATDAQRLHMLCCIIVGAQNDGVIPYDALLFKRVCHLKGNVDFKPLIKLDFLEEMLADASTPRADASTPLANAISKEEDNLDKQEEERRGDRASTGASPAAPEARGAPLEAPGKKQKGAAAPAAGFAEFWLAYPKKVMKPAAIRAFNHAIKRVSLEQMLEALNTQKRTWDPQFIKNPSTWLNNDCWSDEVIKAPEWSSIV